MSCHEPLDSRTGFQPVSGASSPSFFRGQDARGDRLEACPTTSLQFIAAMRDLGIEDAADELEVSTVCSRRREEAEIVEARSIRLLTSAATIVVSNTGWQTKPSFRRHGNQPRHPQWA